MLAFGGHCGHRGKRARRIGACDRDSLFARAGTSHSHLYLYREDGKLLRQLTNDNSGQDSGPIFSPDGETIVFTREKPNNVREFWSVSRAAQI
jgi:Periplasmic component of the Tol biopolymer transport system